MKFIKKYQEISKIKTLDDFLTQELISMASTREKITTQDLAKITTKVNHLVTTDWKALALNVTIFSMTNKFTSANLYILKFLSKDLFNKVLTIKNLPLQPFNGKFIKTYPAELRAWGGFIKNAIIVSYMQKKESPQDELPELTNW